MLCVRAPSFGAGSTNRREASEQEAVPRALNLRLGPCVFTPCTFLRFRASLLRCICVCKRADGSGFVVPGLFTASSLA